MINILPFKQSDSSRCGPASIKMILQYYGQEVLEDEICKRCNWSYELGCTNSDIKATLESYGLCADIYINSTLEDLEYWVKHHVPVIVDWFSTDTGHSSIVVDIDKEKVYLLDPEIGAIRSMLREDFLRLWFDWENTPYIDECDDLILRMAIPVYPKIKKNGVDK